MVERGEIVDYALVSVDFQIDVSAVLAELEGDGVGEGDVVEVEADVDVVDGEFVDGTAGEPGG
jgi:hypothetical protein